MSQDKMDFARRLVPQKKVTEFSTPQDQPLLLQNTNDAAGALSISQRKILKLTHRNQVPHVRIGRRVLYDPRDLLSFIDRQKGGCS